jgi:hypothetical protein
MSDIAVSPLALAELIMQNPSTKQMDALVGEFFLSELRAFAEFRITRNGPDARSSIAAQAWLNANPLPTGPKVPVPAVVSPAPAPAPKPVNKRAQVGKRAFEKAAAAAPDGARIKAGIKARAAALARFDARQAAKAA